MRAVPERALTILWTDAGRTTMGSGTGMRGTKLSPRPTSDA